MVDKGSVLVTGAAGFIGRNLCPVLEEAGWLVRRVVRRNATEGDVLIEDMGPETDWSSALTGMDAVVHLAARVHVLREQQHVPADRFRKVNAMATRTLARQAAQAGVKRFVFVSTIGVHGVKTEKKGFVETDALAPVNDYARSKCEAEAVLRDIERDTGMEVVVLRPPLVYGPGVKANFYMLLKGVCMGLPLPLAGIKNNRDFLYVGNLSHAILTCLSHPDAAGQDFLLADGQAIATPVLIRHIARSLGRPARLFYMPAWALDLAGRVLGKHDMINRLIGSLEVNTAHIRERLGWQPPYSLDDGLKTTIGWYQQARKKEA